MHIVSAITRNNGIIDDQYYKTIIYSKRQDSLDRFVFFTDMLYMKSVHYRLEQNKEQMRIRIRQLLYRI